MKNQINAVNISGAEIQYFRVDPQYWEEIILRFKDTGLRTVSTYTPWEIHLVGPVDKNNPAGILDFEGKTNPRLNFLGFVELIEKHGLNLNFRCGPYCCAELDRGGYPDWLVLGDPIIMVWDYQNRTTQGYWIGRQEGSQPSYLHPEYLQWCEKWLKQIDGVIKPLLKANGGCITMLNIDNEISYIVQDSYLKSDYNPVNVAPGGFYHQFLSQKYGLADNLPYDTKYTAIEDIQPPRSVPDNIERDLAYYLDWAEFKQWVMTEYICRVREMHQANGINDVLFYTNFNPHRPEGVPTRMPAYEKAVEGIVGYDFYRGCFLSYSGYHSLARVLKLMNASLNYTWSPEFMAGLWHKDMSDKSRVSDDHMNFMARCALAHGCKAIGWYMFHDRETWGDAPVSSHGHARPSLDVLKQVGEFMHGKIEDWEQLEPVGDVAIIYDLVQHRHTHLGDPLPCADDALHVGKPEICGIEAGIASCEYEGLLRLIEQGGAQANVVDIMCKPEKLDKYPLAFLPGSPVIETAAAQKLLDFAKQGGIIVLTGTWPEIDEEGKKISFLGIDKPKENGSAVTIALGKGKLIWHPEYIAQQKPEEEKIKNVAFVSSVIDENIGDTAVKIMPTEKMQWRAWSNIPGDIEHVRNYEQPRNLASAVLQRSDKNTVLFVMNHYIDAAQFELTFGDKDYKKLTCISTGRSIEISKGKALVDIDRKSCEIYKVS